MSCGPMKLLPDVSSTSAADVIKYNDVTDEALFLNSRRRLIP